MSLALHAAQVEKLLAEARVSARDLAKYLSPDILGTATATALMGVSMF